MSFIYKLADSQIYYSSLQRYINSKSENDYKVISEALKGGKCSFNTSPISHGKRFNTFYAEVYLYLLPEKLALITEEQRQLLIKICNLMMPKDAGYDIMDVLLAPKLETKKKSLLDQLNDSLKDSSIESFNILPEDIVEKGKRMTEIYTYLYYVENSLRIFVKEVFKRTHGDYYFDKINVSREITKAIERRISEEGKHKWMRIRGNSKIFYLDFADLSSLMVNNWDLFKSYFSDQHWLNVKIDDMAKCRNYVAHNSYIDQLEREVLKTSFSQILRQISRVEDKPLLPDL